MIYKRVWKSSRGTNPSFSATQDTRNKEQSPREGVKVAPPLTFVIIPIRQHNALFSPLPLLSCSSLYLFYLSVSALPSSPWPPVRFIHVKIASYLLASPLSFSHTNLLSLVQDFRWQRYKYSYNIQVRWATRTKRVWQLHRGLSSAG